MNPVGKAQECNHKQLSCFNVHSDVFRDVTDFKNAQGVSIWSNKTLMH